MHILRIEIENIKSHAEFSHTFARGTTAITGPNGAGKTTLIEAIAWVLFDVLEYKKDDFLRRGAKKGSARVTIESGLDEREYAVFRDTGTAWHVTDIRLGQRIADKSEEVTRFLWQHLGLEPGTDLESLFKQAIGVPQGTLTAVFLARPAERKTIFDRLLKVEEYREAAARLVETTRFVDQQIAATRETIARAEGELARSESVEEELSAVSKKTSSLADDTARLDVELSAVTERVKQLDETAGRVAHLSAAVERSRSACDRAELVVRQANDLLDAALKAAARAAAAKPDHERHVRALGRLKELERERAERDRLQREMTKVEQAITRVHADQNVLNDDLARIRSSRSTIESLRPKAIEQAKLEAEVTELGSSAGSAAAISERIESIIRELARLRTKYTEAREELRTASAQAEAAKTLPDLEKRDAAIMSELATLNARIDRDRQFQSEIKGGFCPVLSEKCLNLKEGQTLEAFLNEQFTELNKQIAALNGERARVSTALAAAREGERQAAILSRLEKDLSDHLAEGKELNAKKDSLETALANSQQTDLARAEKAASLTALGDPRGQIALLEKELERETDITSRLGDVETSLAHLESDRSQLTEQLSTYAVLDRNWAELGAERDATEDAHREFLASQAEAESVDARRASVEEAVAEQAARTQEVETAERDLAAAGVEYDANAHAAERDALLAAERHLAEVRTHLEVSRKRSEQLGTEMERFALLRRSLVTEFSEKERLGTVAEATAFIRDTLKEAAPRVARNYVYHVSLEANQMFREITGVSERSLKWSEDYSIIVEEGGYERPFVSLSGGEQMAAALSVRLGLLKQLTDIRIAFFDEPTANLDAARRENLAMQISRITNFDQLFVISHDETFDNHVDNVVSLGGSI